MQEQADLRREKRNASQDAGSRKKSAFTVVGEIRLPLFGHGSSPSHGALTHLPVAARELAWQSMTRAFWVSSMFSSFPAQGTRAHC